MKNWAKSVVVSLAIRDVIVPRKALLVIEDTWDVES